jgi:hypothetical protein
MPGRSKNKPVPVVQLGILILLCVSVLVYMLGVPATLLNPVGAADGLEASVLEGFALLPPLVRLTLTTWASLAVHLERFQPTTMLTAVPFHPPV